MIAEGYPNDVYWISLNIHQLTSEKAYIKSTLNSLDSIGNLFLAMARSLRIARVIGSLQVVVSYIFAEMLQFDEHMFQMGWFNHQLLGGSS